MPAAALEARDAREWYAERDPDVAERFADAVEAAIAKILEGTSDTCGRFQHGDVTFTLCENTTTNK